MIYVGKAKSLRQRLNSYFADLSSLHPRTAQMVTSAAGVEWTVVSTEVEALQLEYNWIKEFDPRFNVRYRDDKSYPELAVTLYEEYPRLQVMRGLLEIEFGRCGGHLLLQPADQRISLPRHEIAEVVDDLAVRLGADLARAGCRTLADVAQQAGPADLL